MDMYRSEQFHYTSNPRKGQPFGVRNTVVIEGPHAYKEHAEMDKKGKVLQTRKHKLTKQEKKAIQNKKFIPTLWHCCKKTRSVRKIKKP